jgi:cysteine desulfurase
MIRESALSRKASDVIWVSAIEHPSVLQAARTYWGQGSVELIPVLASGTIDLDWMNNRIRTSKPALVSAMAVNNETGVIQPWQEILKLCQANGVPFHCDAVQWMGKVEPSGEPWGGCAGVTISAHKFGGPKGTGCLVLGDERRGLKVQAGGAQEFDSRAGTENIAGVVAMMAAFRERWDHPPDAEHLEARDRFEKALTRHWPGQVVIHGAAGPRVWNTCSVSLPRHRAERWILRLDKKGYQVSSGSACSTGKEGPSPVLAAMNVDSEIASRAIRISSGWETEPGNWESLLEALIEVGGDMDESGPPSGPGKVIEI